jgi:hypothetical protein
MVIAKMVTMCLRMDWTSEIGDAHPFGYCIPKLKCGISNRAERIISNFKFQIIGRQCDDPKEQNLFLNPGVKTAVGCSIRQRT